MIILNTEGHNILAPLTAAEYSRLLGVVEHSILATDLAVHFSHLARLRRLAGGGAGGVDWGCAEHVNTITAALMTASDLGASTKPWDYQQKVCSCVKHKTLFYSKQRGTLTGGSGSGGSVLEVCIAYLSQQ